MNPTPKDFFRLNHKEDMAKLAVTLNEAWFQRAVVVALANMASLSCDASRLSGANHFVSTLHSLAAEDKAPEAFPDHSELKSYT